MTSTIGKTATELMIENAPRQAIDARLDQRLFVFDPELYDAFMSVPRRDRSFGRCCAEFRRGGSRRRAGMSSTSPSAPGDGISERIYTMSGCAEPRLDRRAAAAH